MANKQTKLFVIVFAIALIHLIVGGIAFYKWNKGHFETVIPYYTALVTNKESEDYECSKHKRYTCTSYYIYLDGKSLNVDQYNFNRARIGHQYTHYITRDDTPWYINYFIFNLVISMLIIFVMSLVLIFKHPI